MSADIPEPEFIACCHHPAAVATQNCMGCGKPLCMDCVRANGYYCGAACKESVRATEPDAVTAADRAAGAVDQQFDQTVAVAGNFLRRLIWPALILVGVAAAVVAGRHLLRPQGAVVAAQPVSSRLAQFHVSAAPPDCLLLQTDNAVWLTRVATGATLWTVDVGAWGEFTRVVGLAGDAVVLRADQQFIALDRTSGARKWSVADEDRSLGRVTPKPGGLLMRTRGALRWLAATDGQTRWTTTNAVWLTGQQAVVGDQLISVRPSERDRPTPADDGEAADDDDTPRAGMGQGFSARDLFGLARGAAARAATTEHEVRFMALATGALLGESRIALTDAPQITAVGARVVIHGGQRLAVFADAAAPAWQSEVGSDIVAVAGTAEMIVAATATEVTAFAAATGAQLWRRADLQPTGLVVGPDGTVCLTVLLDKAQAKGYRAAKVAERGTAIPAEQVKTLLKLDAATGATRWGVRNIGDAVIFENGRLYVFDQTDRIDLLASSGLLSSAYSVRELNPRNGQDRWLCLQQGMLVEQWVLAGGAYVVAATDAPSGRVNPRGSYVLQVIEAR